MFPIDGNKTEKTFDSFNPVVPSVSKIIAKIKYNQLIKILLFK